VERSRAPRHPYTRILWSSLVEKQSGEAFRHLHGSAAGCWGVFDFERPAAGAAHQVACHFPLS
jgi:hypothetical protein